MRLCLIDADAFIHLRSLSFVDLMRALGAPSPRLLLTDRIAWHDLSGLAPLVTQLQADGTASVVGHTPPRNGTYFQLVRSGIDKGEASAIAWLVDDATCVVPFVSCDREAQDETRRRRLLAWDVFDLVVELVAAGDISRAVAKAKLGPWDDPKQQLGRPRDYRGFDPTFAARSAARL